MPQKDGLYTQHLPQELIDKEAAEKRVNQETKTLVTWIDSFVEKKATLSEEEMLKLKSMVATNKKLQTYLKD